MGAANDDPSIHPCIDRVVTKAKRTGMKKKEKSIHRKQASGKKTNHRRSFRVSSEEARPGDSPNTKSGIKKEAEHSETQMKQSQQQQQQR
jgi:hypothetical protein